MPKDQNPRTGGPGVWQYIRGVYEHWVTLAAGVLGLIATAIALAWPQYGTTAFLVAVSIGLFIALVVVPYRAWSKERRRVLELEAQIEEQRPKLYIHGEGIALLPTSPEEMYIIWLQGSEMVDVGGLGKQFRGSGGWDWGEMGTLNGMVPALRFTVINDGPSPLTNVNLTLTITYDKAIFWEHGARGSGEIVHRQYPVSIHRIDRGKENAFVFYAVNIFGPDFASIELPVTASADGAASIDIVRQHNPLHLLAPRLPSERKLPGPTQKPKRSRNRKGEMK